MRIGVISDIHSNKIALDAVLSDMPEVDGLVCAGDVIGYNPWPAACVDALVEHDVPTVMGNHDRKIAQGTNFGANAMAQEGIRHAERDLTDAHVEWIRGLPDERALFDGRVKVVHGHPRDPNRYTRPRDFGPHLLEDEDVLVMGHTHVQHHEKYAEGIALNPGSVGQPRDRDPRAAYAVFDLDDLSVEERRVSYDIEAVVDAVKSSALPSKTAERLKEGR